MKHFDGNSNTPRLNLLILSRALLRNMLYVVAFDKACSMFTIFLKKSKEQHSQRILPFPFNERVIFSFC